MFTDDLVYLFENAGLSLTYGTNLFKGSKATIPVTSDGPFVSIIVTGGLPPEGTHNSSLGPAYERPSAQIVTRGKKYDPVETMAQSLWALLYPIGRVGGGQFINGTWWRSVRLVQNPFDLSPDEAGRARIAFNIDVVKRVSPATS